MTTSIALKSRATKIQALRNAMCHLGYVLALGNWKQCQDSFVAGVACGELIILKGFARAWRNKLAPGGELRIFFDSGWNTGKRAKRMESVN